jgi:hypothetical protein
MFAKFYKVKYPTNIYLKGIFDLICLTNFNLLCTFAASKNKPIVLEFTEWDFFICCS